MLDLTSQVLAVRITALVLTACLSCFAVQSLIQWAFQLFRTTDQFARYFYSDLDGESEEKAVQTITRWKQRVMITIFTTSAAAVALSRAVIITTREEWLHFGISLLLYIQCIALLAESRCTSRFSLGLQLGLSCVLGLVSLSFEIYREPHPHLGIIQGRLVAAECGCHVATTVLSLLLPRRPDVYYNGIMVDRELSTSFLSRATFSWANKILYITHHKRELDVDDLPELDHGTRAQTLQESFTEAKGAITTKASSGSTTSVPMWKILLRSHCANFIWESLLCTLLALVSFAPHLALLNILRVLESNSQQTRNLFHLWVWVAGLGMAIVLSSCIEHWVNWIAFNKISVRIIEQISIMVFHKAMRLTGSKNPERNKQEGDKDDNDSNTQNTINMVAVDGQRIARFATYSYQLVLAPLRVIIASVMLAKLLGWQSLAAGLACLVVLMPSVMLCGRRYALAGRDLMASRDTKLTILTEVLHGIRQIKFSALEDKWAQRINMARKEELSAQRRIFIWNSATMSFYFLGPISLSVASLGVYAVLNNGLTASVVFTATSILTSITISLGLIPDLLSNMLDALVSTRRLDEYFGAAEKVPNLTPSDDIGFQNASVAWPGALTSSATPWILKDLHLEFPRGKLSLISGRTGSGKSLLLAGVLGECEIIAGRVKAPSPPQPEDVWNTYTTSGEWLIDSATAYVAQLPWIEAATIKQNILFGLPFHTERYRDVLYACALTKDLRILPDGERTEVGPNGVNLSGGQKARISLARALYSRAGILLLDDIFSAVDVHTAQHLYKHALTGPLADGRTRILTTHHVGICLPKAEYIVHLEDGTVGFAGPAAQLHDDGMLDGLLHCRRGSEDADWQHEAPSEDVPPSSLEMQQEEIDRPVTAQSGREFNQAARTFVEKERGRTNKSTLQLFNQYVKASGRWWLWVLIAVGYASYISSTLGRNWWLRIWSNHDTDAAIDTPNPIKRNLKFYFGTYVAFAVCEWILGSLQNFLLCLPALKASERLFQQCLRGVLGARLRWLDTVPVGQILNRFSADFNVVDSRICLDLVFMLSASMECVSVILAGLVNPLVIIPIIPLAAACAFYACKYLVAAREIKRIENIVRSPIYEKFNLSLTGLWTIRAYGKSDIYIEQMQELINGHARAYWHQWLLTRWLGVRMNIIGAAFATCVAILVTSQNGVNAATAGFAIGFTIQLNNAMAQCIQVYTGLELDLNAVDRVLEYSEVEPELYGGIDPPAAWPTNSQLEITDLTVKYAADLPPVLSGLSVSIEGSQRIGIVGRTGAGKSSLALALFQFLEACQGQILIDGIDISKVKLSSLRSRLAIIPQNPVLFSGTVRSNLDPFHEFDDNELLSALAQVHWTASISELSSSQLETSISEGGLNLSQGQRQLLCLARAIVSNPKILMLDEATSAVDRNTDEHIQQALRARFGRGSSTLLVIAHRISTIADFDRILVLDRGAAVEFGHPRDLIKLPNGIFRGMVDEDAEKDQLIQIISR